VVGINQVVWDPATNTLHAESNDLLDQHTRYALIVTNGVHDADGHSIEATLAFRLAPLTLFTKADSSTGAAVALARSPGREAQPTLLVVVRRLVS
jgi:hypothetical protein